MKKLLLILFLILYHFTGHSQYSIYIGSREYPSTPTWELGALSINFGKNTNSTGFLMITTSEDQFVHEYFGSLLYIYLLNGKQITLNKIASDRLDGNISAAYSVNNLNLKLLKSSDIKKIRYNVNSEFGKNDNYSVVNEIVEVKEMEVPVPEAKNMSEIDKMKGNIQSRDLGSNFSLDPLDRYNSNIYYYRKEIFRIPKGSINTSEDIGNLY
jgi:hypothetical protein